MAVIHETGCRIHGQPAGQFGGAAGGDGVGSGVSLDIELSQKALDRDSVEIGQRKSRTDVEKSLGIEKEASGRFERYERAGIEVGNLPEPLARRAGLGLQPLQGPEEPR